MKDISIESLIKWLTQNKSNLRVIELFAPIWGSPQIQILLELKNKITDSDCPDLSTAIKYAGHRYATEVGALVKPRSRKGKLHDSSTTSKT